MSISKRLKEIIDGMTEEGVTESSTTLITFLSSVVYCASDILMLFLYSSASADQPPPII